MARKIKTVGIVGAGTMGSGIAQMMAMGDYSVLLYDIDEDQLETAQKTMMKNVEKGIELGKVDKANKKRVQENVEATQELKDLNVDLVIEAIVEKTNVKQKVFGELAEINDKNTIFATNTSSIPITRLAADIPHPERVVGMHFFNPAHIMKLVEVISGIETERQVAETVKEIAKQIGKEPVDAKDSPGFIVNRVARNFYVESLKILEQQVADVETIDDIVEANGFKMGPFRLMDLIGVDSNHLVTKRMYESFFYDAKFRPSRIQQKKVEAGHHGRKSGKGFYEYD